MRKPMAEHPSIYLDYQASTPVDARVRDAMLPWLGECYGNPHAANHVFGMEAGDAVENARLQVSQAIGAQAEEIIFTSGATEANNLAIKGAAEFHLSQEGEKRHIITLATEHRSALQSCESLRQRGFRVTVLPVQPNGLLDMDVLRNAYTPDTLLVSIMAVNNEIGVIQPIAEIGAFCRQNGVLFHCDAAQALGKIPLDVEAIQADLLSLSGHKAYAPQGVGALYIRRRPRARVQPLFSGGGQERGMRSGTVATPFVVAMGKAAALAAEEQPSETAHVLALRDAFLQVLQVAKLDYVLNGAWEQRVPHNLSIGFYGIEQGALMASLPEIALSAGSACSTGNTAASHVLQAIDSKADTVLRISFGRGTTLDETVRAAELLVSRLQQMRKAA
jgi:cysteine desulfurase